MEFGASLDADHRLGGPSIGLDNSLEFFVAQNFSNLRRRNDLAVVVHHHLFDGNDYLDLKDTVVGSQYLQNKWNFRRTTNSLGGKGRPDNAGQRGTPVSFDRRGKELFLKQIHNLGCGNHPRVVIDQNRFQGNVHLDLGDSIHGCQYLHELGNFRTATNSLAQYGASHNGLINRRIHLGGVRIGRVAAAPGGRRRIVVASQTARTVAVGQMFVVVVVVVVVLGVAASVSVSLAGLAGLVLTGSAGAAGSDGGSGVLGLEKVVHQIIADDGLLVGIVMGTKGFGGRRRTIVVVVVVAAAGHPQEFLFFVVGCHVVFINAT
mmetsp:Transcript_16815/g.42024  ORF Transcript_16815/g.42024 Transcript_16815/m.42024 type:complete len:319 (-) Transcript_16815:293-1249(-)